MADEPVLLFLHGVGDGDQEDGWKDVLNQSLVLLGYPEFSPTRVVAPKFPNSLLYPSDDKAPLPAPTIQVPARDAARQNRRAFEHRTGALEFRLGRPERGVDQPLMNAVVNVAVAAPFVSPMAQARNYLRNEQTRARVLSRVLQRVPRQDAWSRKHHRLGSIRVPAHRNAARPVAGIERAPD